MTSHTSAKFDMQRNPVYAINFEIQSKGRRFAATKRRVKWSFGFADRSAMDQGKSGVECRGSEHEVVFVWSMSSGKQRVLADGIEVSFERQNTDKYECAWTMAGGHEFKLTAHASAPLFNQNGFRQFDLLIDGLSYADMGPIFQLGGGRKRVAPSSRTRSSSALNEQQDDLFASNPTTQSQCMPPRRTQSMPMMDHLADLLDLSTPTGTYDPFAAPAAVSPISVMTVFDDSLSSIPPVTPTFQGKSMFYFNSSTPMSMETSYHQPASGLITPDSSMHSRSSHFSEEDNDLETALRALVDLDQPMAMYTR